MLSGLRVCRTRVFFFPQARERLGPSATVATQQVSTANPPASCAVTLLCSHTLPPVPATRVRSPEHDPGVYATVECVLVCCASVEAHGIAKSIGNLLKLFSPGQLSKTRMTLSLGSNQLSEGPKF